MYGEIGYSFLCLILLCELRRRWDKPPAGTFEYNKLIWRTSLVYREELLRLCRAYGTTCSNFPFQVQTSWIPCFVWERILCSFVLVWCTQEQRVKHILFGVYAIIEGIALYDRWKRERHIRIRSRTKAADTRDSETTETHHTFLVQGVHTLGIAGCWVATKAWWYALFLLLHTALFFVLWIRHTKQTNGWLDFCLADNDSVCHISVRLSPFEKLYPAHVVYLLESGNLPPGPLPSSVVPPDAFRPVLEYCVSWEFVMPLSSSSSVQNRPPQTRPPKLISVRQYQNILQLEWENKTEFVVWKELQLHQTICGTVPTLCSERKDGSSSSSSISEENSSVCLCSSLSIVDACLEDNRVLTDALCASTPLSKDVAQWLVNEFVWE